MGLQPVATVSRAAASPDRWERRIIENGHLYRHNGSGWSWSWVGWIGMTCNGDTCTWSVPRATVGETQTTGEASDLVFHASGSSPTYYGPAFTHQLM